MTTQNRQFRLKARPVGLPKASDFELTLSPVPAPAEGEVLVKVLYISLDPAMRGWMNEGRSYIAPVALGAVMRAGTVGKVIASKDPAIPEGAPVVGSLGVQEYGVAKGSDLTIVDEAKAPLPAYLGGLGMTGFSAYFGLLDVGRPKAGETVLVSGAAGAVGSVVGQLAKAHGCRAVGIAGGKDKGDYLREIGFDGAIDYEAEKLPEALKAHCPKGVDVFFDNVGGATLEAALGRLSLHGRVVVCGAISQYNATTPTPGPANYLSLLVNRARMEGFVVFDYKDRYAEAAAELVKLYEGGKLKLKEHVVKDFTTFPDALLMLFRGDNHGKLVLEVAGP